MKGGFIDQRHDEIRDTLAYLLKEVCNDVQIEPHLQPLSGERLPNNANTTDDARLDMNARGFWQRGQLAFMDLRVLTLLQKAISHRN